MALKDNLYYWNISLKHPEPVVDKYYILDKVIANDENLIKKLNV
ncbi:conserved hypothetical protein [Methanocaldococcus vulcanius M7]|uniref:Uncharacterized protein n=1 Tax=Methanocaldococcus vulcanius (strain ATCC 700851 / DSM 12094 / M7) TaxID=579137 RepID=C9REB4_METVM|nr:hypothetical protein [Methanocaldococcus vulcanius]ACX71916.1 conserved hypothetical protein [Methanocaldococcus vulcanius M7]